MALSTNDLQLLAERIKKKIREEFAVVHLSQNLIDTIEVRRTTFGFEIEIPAEIYDIGRWYKDRAIVYTGQGSYAQQVDVEGGFSGTHTDYVEDAIKDAIKEWILELKLNVKKVDVV